MEAIAKLKNIPMSERKMRLVVDNIRGKNISEALSILRFTKRESGAWLKKLLDSAIANWGIKAEGNDVADFDLFVKTAFVDGGTQIKRFRPAPHGSAQRNCKRTNHVTIIVENRIPLETETVATGAASEE